MRRSKLAIIFMLLVSASATLAAEKPVATPAVPPLFRKFFRIDQQPDRLILSNRTVRFVPEEVARKVNRDGNAVTETQTILKPCYEEQVREIPLDSAQVSEAGGKKLSREEILKRVSLDTIVVVSADGKPVDPVYLKALTKDTLVFVSRPFAVQANSIAVGDGDWAPVQSYSGPLRTLRELPPKP